MKLKRVMRLVMLRKKLLRTFSDDYRVVVRMSRF
jgi:hypothetical protein